MGIALIILFIVLVGPAALLWGADTRHDTAERRRRGVMSFFGDAPVAFAAPSAAASGSSSGSRARRDDRGLTRLAHLADRSVPSATPPPRRGRRGARRGGLDTHRRRRQRSVRRQRRRRRTAAAPRDAARPGGVGTRRRAFVYDPPAVADVRKVGVVGLGAMGAGIAQLCVEAGLETVGREVTAELGEAAKAPASRTS